MSGERLYDVLVLGGVPAGMTAALYAKRPNLRVALLETNVTGGLVNSTYTVENFPSYPEIHGMKLMENIRGHIDQLGVNVEEILEIAGLELEGDEKIVRGEDGSVWKAPALILATDRKPIPLDVPTKRSAPLLRHLRRSTIQRQTRARGRRRQQHLRRRFVPPQPRCRPTNRGGNHGPLLRGGKHVKRPARRSPRNELHNNQSRRRETHGRQALRRHPRKYKYRRAYYPACGRDFRLPRTVSEQRMV